MAKLCTSMGDARSLRLSLLDEFRRRVPFDAFAWLLTDPVTEVGTSPIADVPCLPELPRLIGLKYATTVNRWTDRSSTVARLHDATRGRLEESLVWREMLADHGVTDVVSIVFRDKSGCWAFLDLWRVGGVFSSAEAETLARWTGEVTGALRRCVAVTFAEPAPERRPERSGGVVLLLGEDLQVQAQTSEVEAFLRTLVPPDDERPPVPAAAYNVGAQLLAAELGVDDHPPVARVHLRDGEWVTLRAARIADGIAVTIESTSAADRLDLIGRSANLTARETELLGHVAAGADTAAIAERMFVSTYTVQDHLKSIFTKTGAGSRRELLARVSRL